MNFNADITEEDIVLVKEIPMHVILKYADYDVSSNIGTQALWGRF